MPKKFLKIKECGCVIVTITCGITNTEKGKMYLIGGHQHFSICDKCKLDEANGDDTLYDMWMSDNITDDLKYAGWEEEVCK
jgi:hypothetical protein